MQLHLLNAKILATDLAHDRVDSERQAQYLLASFVIWNIASYSGLWATASPLWSTPSLLEAGAVIAINVFGVFQTFEAGGGKRNAAFLIEFSCLYVPVTITTLVPIWAAYWVIRIGFYEFLVALSQSHSQFAVNLASIGTDFVGLLTFAAVVSVIAVTYWRMVRLIRAVQRQKRHES